jgi:hypothetical protein
MEADELRAIRRKADRARRDSLVRYDELIAELDRLIQRTAGLDAQAE